MFKKLIKISIVFLFLISIHINVKAVESTDLKRVLPIKDWQINFNQEVSFDSAKENIKVKDIKGRYANITLDLGKDKKTIIVRAPNNGYEKNQRYTLNINSNIKSKDGNCLNKSIEFKFYVEGYQPTDYLTNNIDDVTMKKADEIIASVIKPGMTDFEKELALYDYVITHAEYDYVNYRNNTIPDESYRAYGILVKGIGVCEGYSEAMALLLNNVGIECTIVVSDEMNHAWNIVRIDGIWYYLDVTFGDGMSSAGGTRMYDYFNLTDDELAFDHVWDRNEYVVCNDVKYSYENYMYCKDNDIPLDNRTRVISGIVSLPEDEVAENDINIKVQAFKTVYRENIEDAKAYDNYQCETSIIIPKGSSMASYSLVVPAFNDGFIVSYRIPTANNKYIDFASYSNSGMIANALTGSFIDVNEDDKVINLTILRDKNVIVQPSEKEINFQDPNLESRIRKIIKRPTGDIYESDVQDITYLYASEDNIKDLEGIQYLTNITQLELGGNQISNISVLKDLKNLTHLDLSNNQISDINALKNLENLTCLNLNSNQISDISPVKDLTNLKDLNLGINKICDISALKDMKKLTSLALPINKISDISSLKGLVSLEYLNLNENQISNISELKDLTNLLELDLCATKVSSSNMQALQKALPKCTINY